MHFQRVWNIPSHVALGKKPMPDCTQTAHVVDPYTKTNGRCVTMEQQ